MKNSIKLMHEQLELADGSPIKIKWCDYDYFKYPWHFHNEYEIVYILKSTGTRFVGNSIEPFSDGDLVLLGSNLPHMYRNDEAYHRGDPNLRVYAITVQFSKNFFFHAFQHYPEFRNIKRFLESSKYGIYFEKSANRHIRKRISGLLKLSGFKRLIECLEVLSLMSRSSHIRILSDEDPDLNQMDYGDERITKILGRINRDYYKQINLKEVAEYSNMNEAAFCRYFRQKTGKSMMQYINELRIGLACKLLLNGEMSVLQICYECGYNNLSNFNRHFKKITRRTPTEYIKEFKNDLRPAMELPI